MVRCKGHFDGLGTGRATKHPLSERYHGVKDKTISRDLNYLKAAHLIKVEDGTVRANIEVMRHFMA